MSWRATKLKFLAAISMRNGLGESGRQDEPSWPRYVRTTDIAGPRTLRQDVFASLPPAIARNALLKSGDIVMSAAGTIGKSLLYQSDEPACYAGYLVRFRPAAGVDGRFVAYWTESQPYWDQIEAEKVASTIDNFSASKYQNLRLSVPDLHIQRAIVHYLDAETGRIDALLERRRRVRGLLAERRDALIRRATRLGIRDHQLKPSGVPWIGDVPEGWLVLPLRRVGELLAGTAFPDSEQGRPDGSIPYYKVADFSAPENAEYLTAAENTVTREVATALGSPIYPKDAVVFPKIGAALLSNRRRLMKEPSCTDQNIMGLIVRRGLPRYYYYLLQSFDFGRLRMPGPVPLLNEADAASILVPVPPDDEQSAIVTKLDETLPSVARSSDLIGRQLTLLEERRRALITAAVAGELRLPGKAA